MKKNPLLGKHSHNNRESKEGTLLRYLREARKFSLVEAGKLLGMKSLDVDHLENGRKFATQDDIEKFLLCYNVSKQDFETLVNFKIQNRQIVNHFLTNTNKAQ